MAIEDFDIFVFGSGLAGCAATARAREMGKSVAIADERPHFGGMNICLGLPDYVGASALSDTLWGKCRKFFQDAEAQMISVGNSEAYYGRYFGLPRRFTPAAGRYATNIMLAGATKIPDVEVGSFDIDQETKLGGVITFTNGRQVRAKQILSCSYEAQMLVAARVPTTYGREARNTYGEIQAGALSPFAEFRSDPLLTAEMDILDYYQTQSSFRPGQADAGVMAYNFRMCLSKHPNRLPFQPPPGYVESDFWDWLEQAQRFTSIENITSGQFVSEDLLTCNGGNIFHISKEYPRQKTKADREKFWARIYYMMAGRFYAAANSTRSPQALRDDMTLWGLPHDQYQDDYYGQKGWPYHLYVRECRRMKNRRPMRFFDMTEAGGLLVTDSMGKGGYHADSHIVNWASQVGGGSISDGNLEDDGRTYYPVSFEALKPPSNIITNLLECQQFATSRTVECSKRMEPTMGNVGESAAVAACVAIDMGIPVSRVPYGAFRPILDSIGAKL